MKMTIHEKKALFAFGCPSREANVRQFRCYCLMNCGQGVFSERYMQEMEAYFYHKAVLERICNSSMEVLDDNEVDES